MSKWLAPPMGVLLCFAVTGWQPRRVIAITTASPIAGNGRITSRPGFPALRATPDRDGLTNRREFRLRTHPRRADSDRDGLRDPAEVRRDHTNPRRRDTDVDGYGDGVEVRAGQIRAMPGATAWECDFSDIERATGLKRRVPEAVHAPRRSPESRDRRGAGSLTCADEVE
jgi:hypothetical protein